MLYDWLENAVPTCMTRLPVFVCTPACSIVRPQPIHFLCAEHSLWYMFRIHKLCSCVQRSDADNRGALLTGLSGLAQDKHFTRIFAVSVTAFALFAGYWSSICTVTRFWAVIYDCPSGYALVE